MKLGAANSVTLSDLYGLTRFLTATLDDVAAFTDAQILPLLNQDYRKLQGEILVKILGGWKPKGNIYQDELTASKQEYLFPSDILTIDRIEVNYEGGTNTWVPVVPKKQESIDKSLSNIEDDRAIVCTRSNPGYWIYDTRSFWLDPVAQTTVVNGIRIWFTNPITDLATETNEPIFVELSHPLIAYGAAIKYCQANEKWRKLASLKVERAELLDKTIEFYLKRNQDERPRVMPRRMQRRII